MLAGDQTVYLVVEDPALRDALGLLLGARGYRAAVFGSGEDFIHAWRPAWIGCVVLDLEAPAGRSLALQQRLAEIECPLPVIVATAQRSVEGARLAFRAGALDYLEKPLDHAQLFGAIEEAFVRVGMLEVRRSRREQAILHLQQLQNLARGEPAGTALQAVGAGAGMACTGEAAGARYTALLIQAHALMRAGMAGVLRTAGVENSGTAASLGQGLDLLRRMPACDLILVDPTLPDSNGLEAIQALRDAAPGSVVMVLANHLPVELARAAFRAGVRGWLETDVPPELMAQAVESVLRGGRYLPEWLAQDFAERSLAADRELAAHGAGSVAARLESDRVTDRQREVAGLIAEGLSNKEIARRLNISLGTAKNYVAQILNILGVKTRSRAAHLLLNQRGPSLVESG